MMRAICGKPKNPSTTIMNTIFGGAALTSWPMALAMSCTRISWSESSIRVLGKLRTRSMNRLIHQSVRPRAKPAMMPRMTPTTSEKTVARIATVSEVVSPVRMRAKMSRPVPGSTPSGWAQLMPPPKPRAATRGR